MRKEWVICFIVIILITSTLPIEEKYQLAIVIPSTIFILIICLVFLKIEQEVGYYKCSNCENKHTPSYKKILLAPHIGRTRYLKCPNCNKRTWNKKITKE